MRLKCNFPNLELEAIWERGKGKELASFVHRLADFIKFDAGDEFTEDVNVTVEPGGGDAEVSKKAVDS